MFENREWVWDSILSSTFACILASFLNLKCCPFCCLVLRLGHYLDDLQAILFYNGIEIEFPLYQVLRKQS